LIKASRAAPHPAFSFFLTRRIRIDFFEKWTPLPRAARRAVHNDTASHAAR
jgi:hypothetical protein